MDNKTQTYLIYLLVIVALVLLYKVFNWDSYRCKMCGKLGSSKYLCGKCGTKEGFRYGSCTVPNTKACAAKGKRCDYNRCV